VLRRERFKQIDIIIGFFLTGMNSDERGYKLI